ncbi:MAG: DUF4837 family protein [Bacteroidales bacterium]|nr:DUF4837 family protein [Bacteroidales bacterium]
MKKLGIIALLLVFVTIFTSCSNNKKEPRKDRSVGGSSEVLFVTQNDEQWDGQMGQAVRDFFEETQYGLPQPEKNFKVAHIYVNALNDMFKKHRNLIIAEIVPDLPNPIIESQTDWMSAPQYAIKIKAKDAETWVKVFDSQRDDIKSKFDHNERARFMDFFRPTANATVMTTLRERFGFSMTVPEGYYIAVDKDNFMWLRREEVEKSFGLIVFSRPYTSVDEFSDESLIRTTDSVTMKYIPGPTDGSYMTLDKEFITPVTNEISNFPTGYAVEMRGLWITKGEYMAGPYVSYTFVNPDNTRIITVEGYVYYPNKPKRDLLRQVESIIWSLNF